MKGDDMKAVIAVVAMALPAAALAVPVTPEQAMTAASAWVAERHPYDEDMGDPPASVEPVFDPVDTNSVSYYRITRGRGGVLFVSSDTERPPVMSCTPARNARRDVMEKSALRDMLSADYNAWRKSRNALKSSASRTGGDNPGRWKTLLSGRPALSATGTSELFSYIVPGFETGGALTHWNQTLDHGGVGGEDPNEPGRHFSLYDYYMSSADAWGPDAPAGLQLGVPANGMYAGLIPCGCTATALAANLQYLGVTGSVEVSSIYASVPIATRGSYHSADIQGDQASYDIAWRRRVDLKSVGTVTISSAPGMYDWDSVPSNYGGFAPPGTIGNELVSARDTIGRLAFNCGAAVSRPGNIIRYSTEGTSADPAYFITAGPTVFPGILSGWYASGFSRDMVLSGRPMVASVYLSDDVFSGHCVLIVGVSDDGMIRVFFGWGGQTDGWYRMDGSGAPFSRIANVFGIPGYVENGVPLHFRIVTETGKAYNGPVYVKSGGSVLSVCRAGPDGHVRTLYPAPPSVSSSFVEEIEANGVTVTSNRYLNARLNTADRGTVVVPDSTALPVDFIAMDGDLTAAVSVSRAVRKALVVIGGDGHTNSVPALEYVLSDPDSYVSGRALTCYVNSSRFSKGEYMVLSPDVPVGSDPYVRSGATLGYGASSSPRDVSLTIRKALSGVPIVR